MKKALAIILALCLAFSMVPVMAMAAEADVTGTCGDNVEWTLDTETKTITLTGTGATNDYTNTEPNPFIEYRADIETIVIGDGITYLGNRLFRGLTQVKTVTFGADVETMGYEVFYSCLKLAEVNLNDGLTAIGSLAFYNCKSLAGIEIPETVEHIDNRAFKLCIGLTEIVIPNSVTYIGYEVFMGDTALESVTYTNSGAMINSLAFKDCTALVEFTVPAKVNRIRTSAFADSGLQKLFFTDERSLTASSDKTQARIASNSFANCDGLTMYSQYDGWVEYYCDKYGFEFVRTTHYLDYEVVGDFTVNTTIIGTAEDTVAVKARYNGVNVTIEGGEYNTVANENAATVYARDGATITINDGTFTAAEGAAVVYAKNNATVYVKGGFFEAKGPYLGEYFVLNLADNTNSQIIVTGGTFVNFDPSNANTEPGGAYNFVAEGYMVVAQPQDNGDIWYTVVEEGSIAAMIGNDYYETLDEAVAAAKDGDTVVLQKDIEVDETIEVYNDITVDLAGHTVTTSDAYVVDSYNQSLLCVKRGAHLTMEDSVGGGLMDASAVYIAINLTQYGDSETGECASLTVNGGKYIGSMYAIAGNGTRDNTYLEINDGEFIGLEWDCVYHPQDGQFVINGGTFTGAYTAIYFFSGSLEINGGTFNGTNDSAVYIRNTGGTSGYQPIGTVDINNGTFNAVAGCDAIVFEDKGAGMITGFVNGGVYNATFDETYVADGYTLVDNGDGTYGVVENAPAVNYETAGNYTVDETIHGAAEDTFAVKGVGEGVNVTIEGGEYNTVANENAATVYARDGATITINDGTFTAAEGAAVVYAKNNATVYVNGGFFEAKGPYLGEYFVLNLADNTNSQIIVTGGTFVNFDPSNANTEPGGAYNFVAEGYTVVAEEQANGDVWYTVVAQ